MRKLYRHSFLVVLMIGMVALVGCASADPAEDGAGAADTTEEPAEPTEASGQTEGEAASLTEAAEFFQGKTVTMQTRGSPGGGIDSESRIIARYLAEEIGAEVVVENVTGAGGLVMMNNVMSAEPDGLTIGVPTAGVYTAALAGDEGARYELDDITFLANYRDAEILFIAHADNEELQTFEDVMEADSLRYGSEGPGATNHVTAVVLRDAVGLPIEIVTGFESPTEIIAAMARGDIDLYSGSEIARSAEVLAGETRGLALLSDDPSQLLEGVPSVWDSLGDISADAESALRAHAAVQELFVPIVAPPGLPEDRLTYLREVFEQVLTNPELIAEFEAIDRVVTYTPGAQAQEAFQEIIDAPQAYLDALQEAY